MPAILIGEVQEQRLSWCYRLMAKFATFVCLIAEGCVVLLGTCCLVNCRASFEELVLEADGGLRWSRLENLMEESSKSVGYDASQLWLLAGACPLHLADAPGPD